MEDLLNDVAEIRFAAERAGDTAAMHGDELEEVGRVLSFIANLAGDIETYLENRQEDEKTELDFDFSMGDGIDPWSLFGESPE